MKRPFYTQELFKVINYNDIPEDLFIHICEAANNDSLVRFNLDSYWQTTYDQNDPYDMKNQQVYNFFKKMGITDNDNILIDISW